MELPNDNELMIMALKSILKKRESIIYDKLAEYIENEVDLYAIRDYLKAELNDLYEIHRKLDNLENFMGDEK